MSKSVQFFYEQLIPCAFHVSSLKIQIPRNLVTDTFSSLTSFILILQIVLCAPFPNIMKLVLAIFKDNSLTANKSLSLSNSEEQFYIDYSLSANEIKLSTAEILQISLMYIINNLGPKVEP